MSCSLVKDRSYRLEIMDDETCAYTRVSIYDLEEQKEQSTSRRDEHDVKIIKK
jgi:hypothetical protein